MAFEDGSYSAQDDGGVTDTTSPDSEPYQADQPRIKGITCPACRSHDTIFIASGGYLTCSWAECTEPDLDVAIKAAYKARLRELQSKLPQPENFGNGYDDLIHRDAVTALIEKEIDNAEQE